MGFGLFETTAAVAFFTRDFGVGSVMLKSGFDGVKCIAVLGTSLKCLEVQAGNCPKTP